MFHASTTSSLRSLLAIAFLVGLIGCEHNARSLAVDKAGARQSCTTFLTTWKDGKKAADLKPKITGKDSDWEAGKILESFEILPDERTDGANLFLTVRRTIKSPEGASQQQEVGYVVGTSPVVTVFRTDE
ncbi:MAG TPA: hypothetical protein VGM98_03045 [Schlesneria sp.]|jgi:hypothetical protein